MAMSSFTAGTIHVLCRRSHTGLPAPTTGTAFGSCDTPLRESEGPTTRPLPPSERGVLCDLEHTCFRQLHSPALWSCRPCPKSHHGFRLAVPTRAWILPGLRRSQKIEYIKQIPFRLLAGAVL